MANGFLYLGLVLIAFSLLVTVFVVSRTWPKFAPDEPDRQARLARYVQNLRQAEQMRPAWKAIRYPGVTGLVWVAAGLLLSLLPGSVFDQPFFRSLVMPLLTYGPVLALFFYDQLYGKKRS